VDSRTLCALSLFFLFALPLDANAHDEITLKGCVEEWYPYAQVNQDGSITGFTVALLDNAFGALHASYTLEAMPYERCVTFVQQGKYDFVLIGSGFPEGVHQNQEVVGHWVLSAIIHTEHYLHDYRDMDDFEGFNWARYVGYYFPDIIENYPKFGKSHTVSDSANIFKMIEAGHVDLYFEDCYWAQREIRLNEYRVRVLDRPIEVVNQHIGFREGLSEFSEKVDARIRAMRAGPDIMRLKRAYLDGARNEPLCQGADLPNL